MEDEGQPKAMGQVIQIDEARIRYHLRELEHVAFQRKQMNAVSFFGRKRFLLLGESVKTQHAIDNLAIAFGDFRWRSVVLHV